MANKQKRETYAFNGVLSKKWLEEIRPAIDAKKFVPYINNATDFVNIAVHRLWDEIQRGEFPPKG